MHAHMHVVPAKTRGFGSREIQLVVSHPACVLGTELGCSAEQHTLLSAWLTELVNTRFNWRHHLKK